MHRLNNTYHHYTIALSVFAAVALAGGVARADKDDDDDDDDDDKGGKSFDVRWATYFGGKGIERDAKIAVAGDNGVFLAGLTNTHKGLATSDAHQRQLKGEWDALLIRFDRNGEREFATYFGGEDTEYIADVVADESSGAVYIVGATTSDDNIAKKADQDELDGHQDGFIAKFGADGDLLWSTYVGGDDDDIIHAVALGDDGDVYVCGATESRKRLATGDAHEKNNAGDTDAFIAKYKANGKLLWSTYLGGKDDDLCLSLAVQDDGLLVGGWTNSDKGIATKNAHKRDHKGGDGVDGFVALFDVDGELEWGTLLGGKNKDIVEAVAFGPNDQVYVAGTTNSKQGIATSDGHQDKLGGDRDLFLVKFGKNGKRKWGTYYGGQDLEMGADLVVRNNEIYLAGQTESTKRIASDDALYDELGGEQDVFVARFGAGGKRKTATYIGGEDGEATVSLALRGNDQLYLACTTNSDEGLILEEAFDDELDGKADLYLTLLEE